MMKTRILFFIAIACFSSVAFAQQPAKPTSADIFRDLQKLNVLGSVLYVAAHPDDENTRMISYFSNEKKYETTYLSLTRGDGGQNLIGSELREQLGIIRTQELLAARRIDGGKQWFSRANDFGYSKSPEETRRLWNTDQVMADAVWAIRKHRPDIMINRFNHEPGRRTHGHHTASAMIGFEAFDLAGDPTAFPEQLQYVEPWQPKRIFLNTSWWFYGSREAFAKVDKSDMVEIDAGVYYPLIGKSNTEIAAESRSMHQCQGMGNTGYRGSTKEYLKFLKGDFTNGSTEVMEGVNTSWSRVDGGAQIGKMIDEVIADFDLANPASSAPMLAKVLQAINKLPNGHWKEVKQKECVSLIEACLGLYVESVAKTPTSVAGATVKMESEVIQRLGTPITFEKMEIATAGYNYTNAEPIEVNMVREWEYEINIPAGASSFNPYWLQSEASLGMYTVKDQTIRGKPENDPTFVATYSFKIEGVPFTISRPVVYKRNDPVKGETYKPFYLTPAASIGIDETVVVFADNLEKEITVKVEAFTDDVSGIVGLELPRGWSARPATQEVELKQKGESQSFTFAITPPAAQSEANLSAYLSIGQTKIKDEVVHIEYDHIPAQQVMQKAEARVVKLNIKKTGNLLGYIMGAGDDVPASLEQIGYKVEMLDPDNLSPANLAKYDAVITGIRAFNTKDGLKFGVKALNEYVNNGGNVIVQYNTNRRLKTEQIGPYPMKLGRGRVSVEESEIRILAPDHEVMNSPNKIGPQDFENWVQERGLYFAQEWDEAYTPIFSSNDPGEDPIDGGMLVAPFGAGNFIYSGYSWFRQLPAGVPGAYRIFANMISLSKRERP